MTSVLRKFRGAGVVAALIAGLALSACANKQGSDFLASAGVATPGSQQDFVVNVGDRVFFESDSTELTGTSRSTLDKQAQWLQQYGNYTFTIEGHADERGTREYNIALGRSTRPGCARLSCVARDPGRPYAHGLLRQGTPGRGLQRHFVLVAEPPRCDGSRRHVVSGRPAKALQPAPCQKGAVCFSGSCLDTFWS